MKTIIMISFVFIFGQCTKSSEDNNYLADNVRLFENTDGWEIAKAIEKDDASKVKSLVTGDHKKNINFQENKFGQSLLMWSIYCNKFESYKVLLAMGADINLKANDSTKAISIAPSNYETANYLKELLPYKPDVNYVANSEKSELFRTPLIAAAWYSLESTKLLVNAGANVNYSYSENENNNSPLYAAFRGGKVKIIHYLLLEAKADPAMVLEKKLSGENVYAVNMLRTLTFDIGSEEYKLKMEIVDYLKEKGIDYRATPIPQHYFDLYDKEYLEKY